MKKELATFGGGCFWHVEFDFMNHKGVVAAPVGFMGGTVKNPTYKQVCSKKTGHAEVAQVEYDPKVISYDQLLDAFWEMHDPTQLNRQGPDVGDQYRSVIFYHNEEQKKLAEKSKKKLEASGKYDNKIVTAIEPAQTFYKAEEYHQRYFEKTGKRVCAV